MADMAPNRGRSHGVAEAGPPHSKARTEKPLDYPERFPVPDTVVRWQAPYPEYNPPRYEAPSTTDKSPDPALFADLQRTVISSEPRGVRHDGASGEPLNPKGRTGISGRGGLWLWGPNHAADLLLTRFNTETNSLEALLIQRKSGQWAIPGGMVDPGESALQAAMRELKEEAGISPTSPGQVWELHRGYVDDPRNTDNAWMETVVFHKHLGAVLPRDDGTPTAGSDAKAATWRPLTKEVIEGLYASHPTFLRAGLEVLVETPGTEANTRSAAAALLAM